MDRPAISDPARHAYDEIVAELTAEESVKAGQMMGMPMLYPSGRGRPMKAWVVVPIAEAAAWPALAVRAMEALEAHS